MLHALPAARAATEGAVRLSASASAIGALMLIPGVPGRSSASVNVGMVASLWFGYRAAIKTLRDPLPEPETSHDWHALPVAEVQRLLPRPTEEDREAAPAWWQQVPAVRALHDATAASWGAVRDFAEEMRGDLADPITRCWPPARRPAPCSARRWTRCWWEACCWSMPPCRPSSSCTPNAR